MGLWASRVSCCFKSELELTYMYSTTCTHTLKHRPSIHSFIDLSSCEFFAFHPYLRPQLLPDLFKVDVMKTTRHWTSIWDADTQPGQFSYQGGSVMWSSRQYEWGNGLEISESADAYVRSLKQAPACHACHACHA